MPEKKICSHVILNETAPFCHPERSRRRSEGSWANKRLEATDSSLTLRMTDAQNGRDKGRMRTCQENAEVKRSAHFGYFPLHQRAVSVLLPDGRKTGPSWIVAELLILRVTSLTLLRNVFVNFLEHD